MAHHNVIYPVDRSFKPSQEVIVKLREMNGEVEGQQKLKEFRGLAEFLGFTEYSPTTSEVGEGLSVWGGEGDTEADFVTVENFCILVFFCDRRSGERERGRDVWTASVPEDRLRELSKIVGAELAYKTFLW